MKILAVGNSFSEDAMGHLYQLLKNSGEEEVILGNLFIGGCDLDTHWYNVQNSHKAYEYQKNTSGEWSVRSETAIGYGIKDEEWEFITVQQSSGKSGIADSYNNVIDHLVDYINSNKTNPDAKVGWHMTWAYQSDSDHGEFCNYDNDQITMYNKIVSSVKTNILTNDKIDFVIPSGTALQNLRTSFIGDNITRDGYHLSEDLGRYTAGMTWLKIIKNCDIENIIYVPLVGNAEFTQRMISTVKESVNNAVKVPFCITESVYKE